MHKLAQSARAVSGRIGRIDTGELLVVFHEIIGRWRRAGAGGGAEGVVEIFGADIGDEIGAVHAVIEQEFGHTALRDPLPGNGGAVDRIADQIEAVRTAGHRGGDFCLIARLLLIVGRHRNDFAAERLIGFGKLAHHVDAEVVVDMDDGELLEALVKRIFGRRNALQRI